MVKMMNKCSFNFTLPLYKLSLVQGAFQLGTDSGGQGGIFPGNLGTGFPRNPYS